MSSERLVVFCSDAEVDVERIRVELEDVFDRCGADGVELKRVGGPEALTDAGWSAVSLRAEGVGRAKLGEQIAEVTRAFARAFGGEALGLYVEPTRGVARACLAKPKGFPRATEGEPFHVTRQAASWVETDAGQLARYFAAFEKPVNALALRGPVDLTRAAGTGSDAKHSDDGGEAPVEMDEDDRFVEAKLRQARELMDKYRAARK